MAQKFHERFKIQVSTEEAQKRFVNRVKNEVLSRFWYQVTKLDREQAHISVLSILGIAENKNPYSPDWADIDDEFWINVQTVEAIYRALPNDYHKALSSLVQDILSLSEVDLGIRWHNGHFLPSGAPELDERLVNDVLGCLIDPKFEGVRKPFHKGLEHLLQSVSKPQFLTDVVTDMYEALEALAKILTERPDKDLSANAEALIAAVKAPEGYKRLLKEYIVYANGIRHAGKGGQPKPPLSRKEVESFVYLTGLFIRFALIEDGQV